MLIHRHSGECALRATHAQRSLWAVLVLPEHEYAVLDAHVHHILAITRQLGIGARVHKNLVGERQIGISRWNAANLILTRHILYSSEVNKEKPAC